MENIVVYSQREVRQGELTYRVGEDALPFANHNGMFVADGLGGGAGIRVVKVPVELFDAEQLAQLLCGNLFQDKPQLQMLHKDYVKQNFDSLCNPTMQAVYQNPEPNLMRLKKSGYFGSHAVGVAMAFYLLAIEPGEDKANCVEGIRNNLPISYTKIIDDLGIQCAETSMSKIDYFASTLSAAVYQEIEDGVDVWFLNCGDSRSYVLDSNGFRQAAEDQGRNGGMTSTLIYNRNRRDQIQISVEKHHYTTPCVVMCMTDGVYGIFEGEKGFPSSPLYMEGFLLSAIANSGSYEELADRLKGTFDQFGKGDDSNSLAMAFFGFESFDALRSFAQNRNQFLNEQYKLPEKPSNFLRTDYAAIVKTLSKENGDQLKPLLDEAYLDSAIMRYCQECVEQPEIKKRYNSEGIQLAYNKNRILACIDDHCSDLVDLIKDNYTDFIPEMSEKNWFSQKSPHTLTLTEARTYERCLQDKRAAQQELQSLYEQLGSEVIRKLTDKSWAEDGAESVQKGQIHLFSRNMIDCVKRLHVSCKQIDTSLKNYKKYNRDAVSMYSDAVECLSPESIASGLIKDRVLDYTPQNSISRDERTRMEDELKTIIGYNEDLDEIENRLTEAVNTAAARFWATEGNQEIIQLIRDPQYFVNAQELKAKIQVKLDENTELKKNMELLEQQEQIFADYLKHHLQDVSEDKRHDVAKNGWH